MTLNLLVAPDFAPENFPGWYMLSTLLQHRSGLRLHLLMPADAAEQARMLGEGQADLVYANPFDAAAMIREQGYLPVARPLGQSNEMVIATAAGSTLQTVEDLQTGCSIALTDNRDVKLIGLRLLEPADLTEADIQWQMVDNYQAAARLAMKGEVDASFFLAEAYHSLSRLTRSQLKTLIESRLADITHVLLAREGVAEHVPALRDALTGMAGSPDGQVVLDELGIPKGFEPMSDEDVEFMLDLMETLLD